MQKEKLLLNAELVLDNEKIAIEVRYNSKYSLLVRFKNDLSYKTGTVFDALKINVEEEAVDLGKCRLYVEPNIDGFAGHLTFVTDVYDFENLFQNQKLSKLQSVFDNLPIILSYKNNIDNVFKEYTANLNYDLNVYKNIFDSLDREFNDEPKNVKQEIQDAIIETEGRKFMDFLEDKLDELTQLVKGFDKRQHESHGFYFRKQLWNIILCSTMMKRTNLKPRGYAGDSEMMRLIYLNNAQGRSTFSKLMHLHPMGHPGAQAVRNRRKLIVNMLHAVWDKSTEEQKMKVLSVACGPAFELQDIFTKTDDFNRYHFTLLDQDRAALYEAATVIDEIEKRLQSEVEVRYLTESVRIILRTRELDKLWGQFSFIYTLGLFDYLTPPVAKAVLAKLYQIIKPGGELIVGNYHVSNKSRVYMEYWHDWVLFYRTEEDMLNLINPEWNAEHSVFFEETKSQMFLHIRKAKAV